MDDLRQRVDGLPGSAWFEGRPWFHSHTRDTYRDLATRLSTMGLTDDQVIDVLGKAFAAAAFEFD